MTRWSGTVDVIADCVGPFVRLPKDFNGMHVRVVVTSRSIMFAEDAMIWMLKNPGMSITSATTPSSPFWYFFSKGHKGFIRESKGSVANLPQRTEVSTKHLLSQDFRIKGSYAKTAIPITDRLGPYVRLQPHTIFYAGQRLAVRVTVASPKD